jgi:glycosyltransferase involved in cell wall biosynthesis
MGGATSLVDDLAQAALDAGHSVTVLTRSQPKTVAQERYHGYDVIRLDYPLLYEKIEWHRKLFLRSPAILRRIWKLLSVRRIDVVCIGLLDMSAWYLLLLRPILRFRLVVYLHGGDTRKLPAAEPTYRTLLRMCLAAADSVIPVSEGLASEAAGFYPGARAKTRVIHNAIDLKRVRAAVGLTHPREYIAFVGRLVPEKDIETLLRAYAAAQQEIGSVDLIIAGLGSEESKLRQLALTCPRPDGVSFLGGVNRETAITVMKGALFVVLPSVTEGFPIVAVESLAAGKPLIGSSIPGIAAVIQDGYNGRLFPPRDASALSALIRKYCQDRKALRKLTSAAQKTNLDRYDMHRIVRRHLAVYENATLENRAHGSMR